jgi:PadR family transcriptional regulator, regulatory protein PadR
MTTVSRRHTDASKENPTEKWKVQLRKGCLDLAILAALWNGRLYGLEIIRRLEQGSDLTVAEGTIYPLLRRLKAEGLVQSEWVEAAGHPRKYYQLTSAGRTHVMAMAQVWARLSQTLAELLEPLLVGGLTNVGNQRP